MVDLIRETKEFQLRSEMLKQKLAEVEQEYQDTLTANADSINKEFLNFFYWDTDLKTSYIQTKDFSGRKLYTYVDKDRKGICACTSCGRELSYVRSSRSDNPRMTCGACEAERSRYWADRAAERANEREQIQKLKTMPYKEYLQSEHWQKFRKRALKYFGFKCQLCNAGGVLNVHHRTYERRGEEQYKDVIVLCSACHSRFHGKEDK